MHECTPTEGDPSATHIDATVRLFAALAHPARLQVLLLLGREGPRSVRELRARTGLEASALSHQLRILVDARLLSRRAEGRSAVYQLHDHHVSHIVEDALAHMGEEGG